MVSIKILVGGMREALDSVKLIGEAGRAVNGPLATFVSTQSYAFGIETGRHRGGRLARRAGGSFAFRDGAKAAAAQAPDILGPAILKGTASVGAAKRRIRDLGIERIRALTPVRSGKLRASVSVVERPGIGGQ